MLNDLLKEGNSEFNTNEKLNNGKLIVSRRPNSKLNRGPSDFSMCYVCLGTYSKSSNHHICTKTTVQGDRSSARLNRLVEGRFHEKASVRLIDILSNFNDDEVSNLVNYDWLLISFGNYQMEKHDYDYQHDMVRGRLRLLGRVLIEVRKIASTVTDFASLYNAELCDYVIDGIRATAGFDPKERFFSAPATALAAVTQMKHVGVVLRNKYIEKKNKELKEQTDDFISVFTSRAAFMINRQATNTQIKNKRRKVEAIPTNDDVNKLSRFLEAKRLMYYEQLNENFSLETYKNLMEVTMTSMQVFSRRRVGEMQNTLVEDYDARETIKKDDMRFLALSDEAKQRVQHYIRMNVRGKRESPVSILVHVDAMKCLELLLKYRNAAGIPSENKKLFALPSVDPDNMKRVDGCAAMRKLSAECGAAHPKNLRGTKIRKHFATFCGVKEVNDSTVSDVAKFLGHSIAVHHKFYRTNPLDREIVKMTGLLEEARGPSESNFENEIAKDGNDVEIENEIVNKKTPTKRPMNAEAEIESVVPSK